MKQHYIWRCKLKKTQDELRYSMWKAVVSKNKSNRLPREDIFVSYMSEINKVNYDWEIDEVLDTIIENESKRR